jgi:diadenylate cyclase
MNNLINIKDLITYFTASLNLQNFQFSDAFDVLIVAVVIYQVLLLIRGTRAMQMAIGVGLLIFIYYLATLGGKLQTIQTIISHSFPYLMFAIIALFAVEIRRGLAHIGKNPLLRRFSSNSILETYDEIVLASTSLASQRIGGLIVLERDIGLKNYIESGVALDAQLSFDLLVTIFSPGAPLHDGAVIIQKDRIAAAACFLPLTVNPRLSKELGTRHRAAIGVTEESDAVVVVVSEETGIISLVVGGIIERGLDGELLRDRLHSIIEGQSISDKSSQFSSMLEGR